MRCLFRGCNFQPIILSPKFVGSGLHIKAHTFSFFMASCNQILDCSFKTIFMFIIYYILLYYYIIIIILSYYYIVILLYYYIIILLYHYIIILLYYYIIILSFYYYINLVVLQPEVGETGQPSQQLAQRVQAQVVVPKLPEHYIILYIILYILYMILYYIILPSESRLRLLCPSCLNIVGIVTKVGSFLPYKCKVLK